MAMRGQDFEAVAAALLAASARVGEVVPGVEREHARLVLAVAVDSLAEEFGSGSALFNRDWFVQACGLSAEVERVSPPVSGRIVGQRIGFESVCRGDWLAHATSSGHVLTGVVDQVTGLTVALVKVWDVTMGHSVAGTLRLKRSVWGRLRVTLIDPDWAGEFAGGDGLSM